MKRLACLFACLLPLLFTGCDEKNPFGRFTMSLHVSTRGADLGDLSRDIVFPMSGMKVKVHSIPIAYEGDLMGAEVIRTDIGEGLMLQFNDKGIRALYRTVVSERGQFLVLVCDGIPVGARRIEQNMETDRLYLYPELSRTDLHELVIRMKRYLEDAHDKPMGL